MWGRVFVKTTIPDMVRRFEFALAGEIGVGRDGLAARVDRRWPAAAIVAQLGTRPHLAETKPAWWTALRG